MRQIVPGQHEAIFIQLHVIFEEFRVGLLPDEDERGRGMDLLDLVAVFVMVFDLLELGILPFERIHHGVVFHLDARVRCVDLVDGDLAGGQLVAAHQQGDLLAEIGQMQAFFHSGVAAADHDNFLRAFVERTVTRGAEMDARADVIIFAGDFQPPIRCAGGDQHCARMNVPAVRRIDFMIALFHFHSFDVHSL